MMLIDVVLGGYGKVKMIGECSETIRESMGQKKAECTVVNFIALTKCLE